jgi:hypothetical protein
VARTKWSQDDFSCEWHYPRGISVLVARLTHSRINRYFDGKCSDDEILFRAEISRKQLREVLHHYEEYVCLSVMSIHRRSGLTSTGNSYKLSCTQDKEYGVIQCLTRMLKHLIRKNYWAWCNSYNDGCWHRG